MAARRIPDFFVQETCAMKLWRRCRNNTDPTLAHDSSGSDLRLPRMKLLRCRRVSSRFDKFISITPCVLIEVDPDKSRCDREIAAFNGFELRNHVTSKKTIAIRRERGRQCHEQPRFMEV